ncbi:desmoplakin-B isoform X1 [Stegastes partitus]|uniref:Desmoplakin-B isoform X1 n=1 Tax=Stegastes partitus TaxID=144197 RepID=A0A9Y4MZE4_9TELE|nr:PREDICTED: desmoplakin-like isoform X1 [Stegastes partitus]
MSMYGSQQGLNMGRRAGSKGDLAGGGNYHYARSEVVHGGGNGYDPYMEGYKTYTFTKSTGMGGGMGSGTMSGVMSGAMSQMASGMEGGTMSRMSGSNFGAINQRAAALQSQCNEYLKKAEYAMQAGSGDSEYYMGMAKDAIEKLKYCAMDLRQMGQPNDNVVRSLEICKDQLKGVHMAMTSSMQRRRSTRGSSGGWEEPGRSFQDAMSWIAQHKRLIETAPWGDDPAAIEQQLISHQKFHASIQRSPEVDRARDDLAKKGDKGSLHALEQEWDSLQQMSFGRTQQLRDLLHLIQEISKEIMWVNDREEEELMFDWGDKNIDQYIPKKQESYSKLMSALEDKEMELNKLKTKVDNVLKNNHPAADKIEAYKDTLQTQWSWLLQITKCIDVHLKENGAYSQFFKEANETYSALQKEHETVRKKFTCDKNTSLENLLDLLRGLEREKEKIMENKRQVQHLVNKSRSIVRLKPRNPMEKSNNVIVKALCDFKQDQKVICKDNEAILKDNSQRSKWQVTGPGGLDMLVPSVCLIVPPPNPLSISLASKNEQYYEAILSIWNQLYINVKSLVAWQYCLLDIKRINSLTITMLARMRPEEYRQIIKSLETHYEEFKLSSHGSQMFADEDKRSIESQFTGAQNHYDQLVVQLPTYIAHQEQIGIQAVEQPRQHQLFIIQQQHQQVAVEEETRRLEEERQRVELKKMVERKAAAEQEARRLEEERRRVELKKMEKKVEVKKEVVNKEHVIKKDVVKVVRTEPVRRKVSSSSVSSVSSSSSHSLSELHSLRLRLEAAESMLSQHLHVCVGEDAVHDCGLKIVQLETVQRDVDGMRDEYLSLRERILRELEGMTDSDKAQFLRSEVGVINQRLGSLESSSSAYVQRLRALRDMLESVARAEDIVKVHEARLTEKETTSLSPREVEEYTLTLKTIKAELDQKKDVLASMEKELSKASHWNSQVGDPFHRCDMMLSKYTEQVGVLSDRWRRIQGQIDTRLQDLQLYLPQLQHYKQTSSSLLDWIDDTSKRQNALQSTKIENVQALKDHIANQKALNTEIKARRETVESVLKDNEECVNAIKDYETDLSSYTSGLETLLNVPLKRTMLKSPSMDLNQEAIQLQTRYMELLTMSGDYHKFLGELLKNMEELKIRNTRIDLLEEELRLLREDIQDRNTRNKSLEDTVARYQLELSQSQDQLLSMEEVKRNTALQCNATKDSLDSTQSKLSELSDQVARLQYLLDEEKRKRKLAEERYSQQQEEYESVLKKRQNELETVSWSKMDIEKSVANKDHEIENLRRQLDAEAARVKELQTDISKTRAMMQSLQSQYDDIVKERDALLRKLQLSETDRDHIQRLEEENSRLKLSQDSELRNKQRLQEENERVKRDLSYWKDQCDSKQGMIRQYDTDKDILEREKKSLKSEIDQLMRDLKDDTNKGRLSAIPREMKEVSVRQIKETELKTTRAPLETSTAVFDGVRKPVTASQLLDCGVLDKPTFSQLMKGHKTVPAVSVDKKVNLKGTGPIAGVVIEGPKSPGSMMRPLCKMTFTEAKKENLVPPDSVDLLLDAQAATGHIIDPRTNQKLTVEEACNQGVVDDEDRERLLAAEAAAVGYSGPGTSKPLSVFQAMEKGLIDKTTTLRLLQAQESTGGILDPFLSVFLPKDTAIERDLIDDTVCRALSKRPELYLDPENEEGVTYNALKRRCRVDPDTGLLLLPIPEKVEPSKLVFDGVRKPVTANQLLDCGVLDKPTFKDLEKGKKTVPEVSVDKKVSLKGTGPIAGVIVESKGKMSFTQAKKQMLLPDDSADLLLEAQAATGHIIDPRTNQKLTVEEACATGVVDIRDQDKLLAAEAAAVGYKDPTAAKPLSVFEAMKKGHVDKKTALRLLQAQESAGGILDPNLSVFLPKDTAIKRNLVDEDLCRALSRGPQSYLDPDTERDASYGALKKRCKTESDTGLMLLTITERKDPSKLMFDGVRKPVSAEQLFDCGVLDKPTVTQLMKGEKTVPQVSEDKKIFLKGTGSIAGVAAGPSGKMSFSEAKKMMLMAPESADLLLEAQAATGHIIDPTSNQKLTVEEACARGVVDNKDRDKLLKAEAAAVGYREPNTAKPLSVFEAMKKGHVDKKTALRLLQAQESAGGILDPNISVFLPKDTAIKRNLMDEDLCRALSHGPPCYLDPDTERDASYGDLKKRCKTEPRTGLILLPITERKDPSKLMFDGVCKPVSAQQLFECGVLDKPTFNQLVKGEKTVPEVSLDKKVFLKGTGAVAGVAAGPLKKMSFTEAKKLKIMTSISADMLLDAQAATGHIIDPRTNQKLTVKDACARGVVKKEDESRLCAAEAAAIGYMEPHTAKLLSAGQAMKKGIIDKDTALRVLQAQVSVGGILDPVLSVFLPKDIAKERDLIDETLSHALNQSPECYLDPDTQQTTTYVCLKKKCKVDPSTGLLLLPEPKKPLTVQGIRGQVSVTDLVDANLLKQSDVDQLREGRLTSQDIEDRLSSYLGGSTCIAGVYDEASGKVLPVYQAMKDELLPRGTTLELLEAQAASGFIMDPVNNLYLTVSDAYHRGLFGPEFKDKLLEAEMAVTGYKLPGTDNILSLFQAIERGLVERGQGLRLLEAQIASGGIIDPKQSHRIDVNIAHKRGYFDDKMNKILADQAAGKKGFCDPNTEENLTYLELKKRCITDKKTGLILLPINEKTKQKSTQKNTLRKRRVVIVDPETKKEMTVREAFDKGYIDHETFVELSMQECEWQEVTITAPDGSTRMVFIDKKTGREYDITELLKKKVISESVLQQYRTQSITLTAFADIITNKIGRGSSSLSSLLSSSSAIPRSSAATGTSSVTSTSTSRPLMSLGTSSMTSSTTKTSEASVPSSLKSSSSSSSSSSSAVSRPLSPTFAKMTTTRTTTITERGSAISSAVRDSPDSFKHISSMSVTLASPDEAVGEQEPVGAIFDTDNVEKISITEALNRDLVDSITAQRLLEAQACTGGIVNPANGDRLGIQEAAQLGIIHDDMVTKLKPAQKAYIGFEDVKTRKKMSAAQALKEMWLPYEAGQRFMEFQVVTGGLYDPEVGCRRTIEDALKMGWLDGRAAQKLQDMKNHPKLLTCPKSKLKISYKEALDNCLVEESTGVKMLQASSVSSRGISSPYNVASAPGSTTGSRSGSRRSSRRASLDLGSPTSSSTGRYSLTNVTNFPFYK